MSATDPGLAGCRLMVATPIYEGAQGTYVRAMLDFALRAQALGVPVRFEFILYQPSITRARDMLTAMFLASDYTHLLFIDADIDFSADDVFSLIRVMTAHPECGVVGGAYARRMINWRNVARAVEMGLAKDNPADLARFSGDFALHFLHADQSFKMTDLVELTRLGTAMMLIRREVLEGMRTALPDLVFRPDPAERQAHGVGEFEPAFFCPLIEPESQALLSDDYAFCRRVRDAGFRIWLAPWIRTTHAGPAIFSGTLADTVQLFSAKPESSSE